ncbi:BlaR1 peptidase M56 [Singulisphaera sp. GP187]|uniref:M56 family metallopeptidase n=1 Tax=Singulisphaera sp. GP187 TaxID=1882752 RepID=UPI000928C5B3|nr:M56 family metallopeptidase [Singulisphaera sp. GP187]SIO67491.1 BlaR1 peptidase M56 [Singulisphaera sp. GP187]
MQALATEAIQGLSGGLVWLGLLHSLWFGLLTAALVALLFQTCRAISHKTRHATLLAALCLVAFSPLVLTTIHYFSITQRSKANAVSVATAAEIVPGHSTIQPRDESSMAVKVRLGGVARAATLSRFLGFTRDRGVVVARLVRPFALTAWVLTVLGLSIVLALGMIRLNQLCRDASPAPGDLRKRAQKLGRRLRLKNIPAMRIHPTLDEPCLCGAFRPVILLPERWLAAARADSIDAVLAHELAHARRADHLVNLAQRILESVLFFHPGVRWLSQSLRRQRELCADALAVRITGDPLALARALEAVARLRVGPPTPRHVGATFMGEGTSLLPRIQELIGMKPHRLRPQFWPFAALPSAVAVAFVAASLGFAEDDPAPPRTVVRPPAAPQVGRTSANSRSAPSIPKAELKGQVSYQVRSIDLDADAWRHHLQDRLPSLEQDADGHEWIFDEPTLFALIRHAQAEAKPCLIQAPTIVAYENDRAFVFIKPGWTYYGSGGSTARSGEGGILGLGEDEGRRVNITGSHLPHGTNLQVELFDSTLIPRQAGPERDPKRVSVHKLTNANVVRYKGSSDVPDGSSLAVSLGRYTREVGPGAAMIERLVIVTPRRIILELDSEGQPVIKSSNKPAASPEKY